MALAMSRSRRASSWCPRATAFGGVGPRSRGCGVRLPPEAVLDAARREARPHRRRLPVAPWRLATETEDDPEGEPSWRRCAAIVGPDVPIVASFDLHAHLTDRMVAASDALIAYRTIPHVDFVETGARAMELLIDAMRGRTHPVVRQRKMRMIASAEKHDTNHGPMVAVMAYARALEERPGVLSVSVTPTQPWMDVPELGWSVTVVADGDPALAQACADELAWLIWDRRDAYRVFKTPVPDAVAEAMAWPGRPVILADASDSPSAGANGDGNDLLKELIRIAYVGDAILTVVDPVAAGTCTTAGVGATVTVQLGGTRTPAFYIPVEVTGTVVSLHDGKYLLELPVRPMDIGPTAVLRVGGMRIVVCTRKAFHLDESVFHQAGLDPRTAAIVQVKSAGGFRGVYEAFASLIIEMDTDGLCTSDLTRLPFRRIPRPMWPWELDLAEPWPGARRPGGSEAPA